VSLKLYYHPLASYCHKALIALYENNTPFEPVFIDLGDEKSAAQLRELWPMAKFPVLRDEGRQRTVAESTVIIEYLDAFYPGRTALLPSDPDLAWQARLWDRFFDQYVQMQMQVPVNNALRPAGEADEYGARQALSILQRAYDILEKHLGGKMWVLGDAFSLADCAASPALFYADLTMPLASRWPNLARYLDRLIARPAFARVLAEAEPYFHLVPLETKPRLRQAV
jgi:glutathione S-transferase